MLLVFSWYCVCDIMTICTHNIFTAYIYNVHNIHNNLYTHNVYTEYVHRTHIYNPIHTHVKHRWAPLVTQLAQEAAGHLSPSAMAAYGNNDPREYVKVCVMVMVWCGGGGNVDGVVVMW